MIKTNFINASTEDSIYLEVRDFGVSAPIS